MPELRCLDRWDIPRFTVELLRGWKAVAEDRARYSLGKTSPPLTETEAQRKMKKILGMKDKIITLRWLNAPQHSAISGRVRGEAEIIVKDCDEDRVSYCGSGSGTLHSLPLEQVLISYDEVHQRPALEVKP